MTRKRGVTHFSGDEIAFIVKCAGAGLTARAATARLNAKFGKGRKRGSLITIARKLGAPFGFTKTQPAGVAKLAESLKIDRGNVAGRHERTTRFSFQPVLAPGLRGGQLVDLERRADEPAPLGPRGEFARGCKWIDGEPRSQTWQQCGHKRAPASAYCEYHRTRTIRLRMNMEATDTPALSSPARGEDKGSG